MEFTFNGISSRVYNLKIKKSNHLSIPKKRLEFIEVDGRTDNLIIDDGTREILDIQIECFIDCRDADTRSYAIGLDNWLNGHSGYKNLKFDDGTELKAIFVGQLDFEYIFKNFNEILLQFKAYRESDL